MIEKGFKEPKNNKYFFKATFLTKLTRAIEAFSCAASSKRFTLYNHVLDVLDGIIMRLLILYAVSNFDFSLKINTTTTTNTNAKCNVVHII